MDRHAVPRSVTNFEFKLIGWFTVKQFMYLLICAGIAVVNYFVIPVPILNILMSVLIVVFGIALVFYKHNERPLDVWIKNMIVSLLKPSQFLYHKDNDVPDFLKDVYLSPVENTAAIHLDASQKLSTYMAQTGQQQKGAPEQQAMNTLIHTTPAQATTNPAPTPVAQLPNTSPIATPAPATPSQPLTTPFLSGVIRNNKEETLPNIMVYVNSDSGQIVRILKTNHNGIFATFHPLPAGTYILGPKDLGGTYFFDTMNVTIEGPQREPLQIFSKELL
jgi:PrgI family protein